MPCDRRLWLTLALVLSAAATASPQEPVTSSEPLRTHTIEEHQEQSEQDKTRALLEVIRRRAKEALAKRRRARRWDFNTYTSWRVGYETNPRLSEDRNGGFFSDQYAGLTYSYRVLPQLTWQAGYGFDAMLYDEFTDLNTATNSLTTKLLYRIAKPFRIELHYTFDDVAGLRDNSISVVDQAVHLRLLQHLWHGWYQYAGWTYFDKQFKDRLALNGRGVKVNGMERKDTRDMVSQELGAPLGERAFVRLHQQWYRNWSNDVFRDYYDADDYQVRVHGRYEWTPRWASSAGFGYELKQYQERTVTSLGIAQRDDTTQYDLGLTYRISPEVDLAYTWRYRHNHSNDASQSYDDATNAVALNAAF